MSCYFFTTYVTYCSIVCFVNRFLPSVTFFINYPNFFGFVLCIIPSFALVWVFCCRLCSRCRFRLTWRWWAGAAWRLALTWAAWWTAWRFTLTWWTAWAWIACRLICAAWWTVALACLTVAAIVIIVVILIAVAVAVIVALTAVVLLVVGLCCILCINFRSFFRLLRRLCLLNLNNLSCFFYICLLYTSPSPRDCS